MPHGAVCGQDVNAGAAKAVEPQRLRAHGALGAWHDAERPSFPPPQGKLAGMVASLSHTRPFWAEEGAWVGSAHETGFVSPSPPRLCAHHSPVPSG